VRARAVLSRGLILAVLFLAGCSEAPRNGGESGAAEACDLRYPDGSAVPCDASKFSDATLLDEAPAPSTGWLCKDDSEADDGNRQQLWMDAQGTLGIRWEWSARPLAGPGVLFAAVYQDGQDQVLLFPYQDVGFASFPLPPLTDRTMEVHILAWDFRLLANPVDPYVPAHWSAVEGVQMLASTHGVDPWIALVAPRADGGWDHVDVNGADTTTTGAPVLRPRENLPVQVGETWYVAEVSGGGAKFPGRDPVQMRANPGFCYLEDLPA
jgi:hypothetical protein